MTMRTRKLLGTVMLLVLVVVYALLALAAAVVLQVNNASKIAELIFYVVAGLLWVLPAAWIVSWMSRQDTPG